MIRGHTFTQKPSGQWQAGALLPSRSPGSPFVFVEVWSSGDRWRGHTAISVTFPSDVQYVPFPADDRGEPAAVHPSPSAPPHTHTPTEQEQPTFNIITTLQ